MAPAPTKHTFLISVIGILSGATTSRSIKSFYDFIIVRFAFDVLLILAINGSNLAFFQVDNWFHPVTEKKHCFDTAMTVSFFSSPACYSEYIEDPDQRFDLSLPTIVVVIFSVFYLGEKEEFLRSKRQEYWNE